MQQTTKKCFNKNPNSITFLLVLMLKTEIKAKDKMQGIIFILKETYMRLEQ
jgi:hypothetical protein